MDYLLRSYTLYRIESAYAIRDDIMDTVKYVGARTDPATQTVRGDRQTQPHALTHVHEFVLCTC